MIHPQYPQHEFRIRKLGELHHIFCEGRRKWVKLTPEEWVRQNCYQWLIQVLHYPGQLIAIEKEMDLNGRKKRFDLLVYDKQHKPWMLVECKRQELPLNATVLWQAIGYNIAIPVSYFLLSNGVDVRIMSIKGETKKEMDTMPLHE